MTDTLTIPEYKSLKKGVSKYRNKIIHASGKKFDSKKEYNRYLELQIMERAGLIKDLLCQVSFTVILNNIVIGLYISDFTYYKDGEWVVEDVKSVATKTPLYRWKKKCVEAQYGIKIQEI